MLYSVGLDCSDDGGVMPQRRSRGVGYDEFADYGASLRQPTDLVWPRPATPIPGTDASEIDMSEVGLFDLIDAFRGALNRYKQNHPQSIELKRTVHKISDKMRELYTKLHEKSPIRLLMSGLTCAE